jgi:hypothetical protein
VKVNRGSNLKIGNGEISFVKVKFRRVYEFECAETVVSQHKMGKL